MNKVENPWSEQVSIVVETDADRQACKRALGAAQVQFPKVLAMDRIGPPSLLEIDISEEIARGLADIALGKYEDRGFSGLTQAEASRQISVLSGSVEDFFAPILQGA